MKLLLSLSLLVVLIILSNGHPQRIKYPPVQKGELPPIWSYHIHCLFVNSNMEVVKQALQLHSDFQNYFYLASSELRQSTFDEKRLCMFDFELYPDVDSPFISGNWAVFIPTECYSETIRLIAQLRGNLDIFIHPNSGAEVSDQTKWALWGVNVWPINVSAFSNQTLIRN